MKTHLMIDLRIYKKHFSGPLGHNWSCVAMVTVHSRALSAGLLLKIRKDTSISALYRCPPKHRLD